jgi:hypothetical protein
MALASSFSEAGTLLLLGVILVVSALLLRFAVRRGVKSLDKDAKVEPRR